MEHIEKEFKYWKSKLVDINSLEQDILVAISEIERYEGEEQIVQLIVDEHHGIYVPMILMLKLGIYESEEEWDLYYRDEEGFIKTEMLQWDTDELIEEIDEELQELVEFYEIVPAGYAVNFGWFDGALCLMIYTIS